MMRNRECLKTNLVLRHLLAFTLGFCVPFGAHADAVSFAPQQTFPTFSGPFSVAVADINADHKPDVITANYNNTANGSANGAAVLLNTTTSPTGNVSFAAWQGFTTQWNSASVAIADVNHDTNPDLIVADYGGGVVSVLINTTSVGAGSPSFASQQAYAVGPFGNEEPISVATADINMDDKPDVITADFSVGKFTVLLNTTSDLVITSSFAAHVDFTTGTGGSSTKPRSITAADINGDGKPDVIVANRGDNTISVFLNTTSPSGPTPTFAAQQIFATGSNPTSVVADDVNGDGKLDLIVANNSDNTVSVFLNTRATTPGPATFATPVNFAAGISALSAWAVATADLDGDGKPDLIVVDRATADNLVSVLINTTAANAPTPSFAAQQTFATGLFPLSVATADVNGDGKLDLIVANESGSTVSVLINTTAASDVIFASGFEP